MKKRKKVKFFESWKRSLVKAITYRILVVILDFIFVYLLTGKYTLAIAFVIISNIYTTVGYFVHERIWARLKWGTKIK